LTVGASSTRTWAVIGGLIYFILLITLGLMSLRKGHWVMFILGIFVPLFWLIGGLMGPTPARAA
jgi:ABC-type multidrug transport system permease subunit